jgi:putative SOS response-associated peptidase YedK
MCGRFAFYSPKEAVQQLFGIEFDEPLKPRYNIAPTQSVAAIRNNPNGARELAMLRWGLVPSWAKELAIGNHMINARAESLAEKPAFRVAYRRRRCAILASGFYEWRAVPSGKAPYFISAVDGRPIAFAGLWERWEKTAHPIETCTIITTDANLKLRPLHDRMPVILRPEELSLWLDAGTAEPQLRALLAPAQEDLLNFREISRAVNNPKNDGPELIAG